MKQRICTVVGKAVLQMQANKMICEGLQQFCCEVNWGFPSAVGSHLPWQEVNPLKDLMWAAGANINEFAIIIAI